MGTRHITTSHRTRNFPVCKIFTYTLGHMFLYLLDYVTLIRILKFGYREKIELQPKAYKINAMSHFLYLLNTSEF